MKGDGDRYVRADIVLQQQIVNAIYNDYCLGATYSNILNKLMGDEYGFGKKYSRRAADAFIAKARAIIKEDFARERPEMKEKLYAMLLDVYNESREIGDRGAANKSIEQIAKLTGAYEPTKQAIQINKVDIDFNLDDNE